MNNIKIYKQYYIDINKNKEFISDINELPDNYLGLLCDFDNFLKLQFKLPNELSNLSIQIRNNKDYELYKNNVIYIPNQVKSLTIYNHTDNDLGELYYLPDNIEILRFFTCFEKDYCIKSFNIKFKSIPKSLKYIETDGGIVDIDKFDLSNIIFICVGYKFIINDDDYYNIKKRTSYYSNNNYIRKNILYQIITNKADEDIMTYFKNKNILFGVQNIIDIYDYYHQQTIKSVNK